MAYATKQDMIDRFSLDEVIAITDRASPPANAVDDTVLTRALEAATAEVNSEARLTGAIVVTDQLSTLTCQIARYHLTDPCAPDSRVRKDYEDAIGFLRRVADGRSMLVGQDAAAPATQSPNTIQVSAPPRRFTQDTLKDF